MLLLLLAPRKLCLHEPRAQSRLEEQQQRPSGQSQSGKQNTCGRRSANRTNAQSSGSVLAALRPLWNWGSSSISYLRRKSLPAPAYPSFVLAALCCPLLSLSSSFWFLLHGLLKFLSLTWICCLPTQLLCSLSHYATFIHPFPSLQHTFRILLNPLFSTLINVVLLSLL